jgi:hypothetical protein
MKDCVLTPDSPTDEEYEVDVGFGRIVASENLIEAPNILVDLVCSG